MKNILHKNLILGVLALFLVLPLTVSAAVFTTTTMVSNYNVNLGVVTPTWSQNITATPGEIVSVQVSYNNISAPDALNTVIKLNQPVAPMANHTMMGSVGADATATVTGTALINLTSAQTLTFIPGSLKWYPNQGTVAVALPAGQVEANIFSATGLNLGTITVGPTAQGKIVLDFQVSNTSNLGGGYTCPQGWFVAGTGCSAVQMNTTNITNPTNSYFPSNTTSPTPIVRTDAVSGSGGTYSILNGFIDPLTTTGVSRWFEWGTNSAFLTNSSPRIGHGTVAATFSETISELQPNTTYYYRAAAQSGTGQVLYGQIMNFTTQVSMAQSPSVITNTPTGVLHNQATLKGYVNPFGAGSTVRYFQWGTNTTSLTNQTSELNYGATAGNFTQAVTNLSPNTTYYYRAVAQNSSGIFKGSIVSFKTATSPATTTSSSTTTTPPAQKTTTSKTVASKTTTASSGVELVTMSIDTTSKVVGPGERVTYVVKYANNSRNTIPRALVRVILPTSLSYESSNNSDILVESNIISLDVGKLAVGDFGSFSFESIVDKKAKDGESLTVAAILSYIDSSAGSPKDINDYAISQIDKDRSQTASVFSSGAGFFSDGFIDWLILLLLVIILIILVRFILYGDKKIVIMDKEESIEEEYEPYRSTKEDDSLNK